jgi:hypothetical protein
VARTLGTPAIEAVTVCCPITEALTNQGFVPWVTVARTCRVFPTAKVIVEVITALIESIEELRAVPIESFKFPEESICKGK